MNSGKTTTRMERIAEGSPRFKARMAGVFEFLEGLTSSGGQVAILGGLVVADNATTTAANILAHMADAAVGRNMAGGVHGTCCLLQ